MIKHALLYARKGLRVLPIYWPEIAGCGCGKPDCSHPGKHPLTRHGIKDASSDAKQVAYWWKVWPDANIAIATGSGLAVLDIDDPKVIDINKLSTRISSTGKGFHAFYRVDRPVPTRTRARPGLDIKGEGGQVLIPPSVHHTGTVYRWVRDIPAAPAPPWFYKLAEKPPPKKYDNEPREVDLEWTKPIPDGGRNNQLFRIARRAVAKGKGREDVRAEIEWINSNRCEPPLQQREVDVILRSACRY